jgi:hypothetical protein
MCINNVSRAINSQDICDLNKKDVINAFMASEILAIAFGKIKEDVIKDLIQRGLDEKSN